MQCNFCHILEISWSNLYALSWMSKVLSLRADPDAEFSWPTPWSRVLLEKLMSSQMVKKPPIFCGKQRFITLLTRAHHLSVYEFIPFHQYCHFKINFNNEAQRMPRPSCGLFILGFHTKILFAFLFFPHYYYMPNLSPYPLFDYPNNIL